MSFFEWVQNLQNLRCGLSLLFCACSRMYAEQPACLACWESPCLGIVHARFNLFRLCRWEEDEVNRSLDRKMTECFAEIWQVLPNMLNFVAETWQPVALPPRNQDVQHV